MLELKFKVSELRPLIEHALNSERWGTPGGLQDDRDLGPALLLLKGEGVAFVSNGLPPLVDDESDYSLSMFDLKGNACWVKTVYAEGKNPNEFNESSSSKRWLRVFAKQQIKEFLEGDLVVITEIATKNKFPKLQVEVFKED